MNGWEHRRELAASVIRRHQPDVFGTQEGYFPQIDQLLQMLPEYGCIAVGRDDGYREGETCALFYRRETLTPCEHGTFWFSETPEVAGSRHWTPNNARICTWAKFADLNSLPFSVYNVHLDHESQFARASSCRMLLDRMKNSYNNGPAVVLGDFNMTPHNPAYSEITGNPAVPLLDSFPRSGLGGDEPGTFHDFTGRTDMECIDYIFVSRHFRVESAAILRDNVNGMYPSDHFPILAALTIAQQTDQ